MIESGYAWLAEEIARDENNDLLQDIDNESVREWVARSGLTVGEHALIQPCYEMPVCPLLRGPCWQQYFDSLTCACIANDEPDGTNCGVPGDTNVCIAHECRSGSCEEIKVLDCDDGDPCTWDECDPREGCSNIDTCNTNTETVNTCRSAGPPMPSPSRGLWSLLLVAGAALLIRRR
jgi:MYXO-CTERM domain-containing protein